MQRRVSGWNALALAMGISLMGCATNALGAPAGLTGQWGGNQAILSMTETGGRLDLGCGSATIDAPIRPNAAGKFAITAHFEAFVGGPTRADEPPQTTPAQLSGHVEGDTLHLSLRRQGAAAADDYTLERGRRVKLIRCM